MENSSDGDSKKSILQSIKGFSKKKDFFTIEQLLENLNSFSEKDIPIAEKQHKKTLKSLMKDDMVVFGSKLTKTSILQDDLRREILEIIQEKKEASLKDILEQKKLKKPQAVWHLKFLEKFDLIEQEENGEGEIRFKPLKP